MGRTGRNEAQVASGEASPLAAVPPVREPSRPSRPSLLSRPLLSLSLGALGVVYGDIGTSPLYALKECFAPEYGIVPSPPNVLGVLSLIFWSLNFVVSIKYLIFIMRAHNRGEGGIMALLALLHPRRDQAGSRRLLIGLGLFGAALLYGDGVITPAISVLGAVEGVGVATPALTAATPAIAALILLGLFMVQKHGTARVGAVFGRIMLVWFSTIAVLGAWGIAQHPTVLRALNPLYGLEFLVTHGRHGFLILGAVILAVTGAEALYADMGHFGKRPIRLMWGTVVLPSLALNYFGQGAVLLARPQTAGNPFYGLVPGWALYPMVVVATTAAVVASQALISGAFSLTRQAVQLGYSPRVTILHTSQTEIGQIYLPGLNRTLGLLCILLVLGFQSSGALASAYGIAVTGTMTITTILFCAVARERWNWSVGRVVLLGAVFLVVDLSFLAANLVKIAKGGWFPLLVAAAVYVLMTTWKRGREAVTRILHENALPLPLFLEDMTRRPPPRVQGTAVFMTSDPGGTPVVLLHHLKHNKVLHERVVIMSISGEEIPQLKPQERAEVKEKGGGFYLVTGRYGFMESPDVPGLLNALSSRGFAVKPMEASFYLGRETLLPTGTSRLAGWRKKLFIFMARNAQSATAFFNLPPNRVVELGAQIQL
jgi:KUP system potassium uptake protein